MALASGTRLGPYEIVALIGSGGMGEVYRARDTQLKRDVALKVLPAAVAADVERLARFQREAELLAALNHPHIAQIYGVVEAQGVRALVMELVEGPTLSARIASGALPLDEALGLASQLAEALEYAHERGIIHRDLKPANITLTADGAVKVLDFGLAKALAAEAASATADDSPTMTSPVMTRTGVILGTAAYMSPEQARSAVVDKRADIWAFGVVLYEMLTGRPCFGGETVTDVLAAVMRADPDWARLPAETPPRVRELLERCLARDRRQRLRDIGDARLELEKALASGETTSGARAVASAGSPAPRWRRRLSWALAGLLLVAAGAIGALVHRSFGPGAPRMPEFTIKSFERQVVFNARFMPDAQTIVYSAARTGNATSLYEIRPDTLEARPLGPPRMHLLAVSSKGELAVLTGVRYLGERLFAGQLARMSFEGAPKPWMDRVREADWSPDGTTLAIAHDTGSGDRLEYPVGKVLYETAGYVSDLRVSPDGTRVAFMDHKSRYDNRGWVKVVNERGQVTTLAGEFWGEEGLAWSADGTSVLFGAAERNASDNTEVGRWNFRIYEAPAAASARAHVALASPINLKMFDAAADGRWLAVREDERLRVGEEGH